MTPLRDASSSKIAGKSVGETGPVARRGPAYGWVVAAWALVCLPLGEPAGAWEQADARRQGQTSGTSEAYDPDDLAGLAHRHARALRPADVFGGRVPVVYAGEDHRDRRVKAWLAEHLEEARAAGIAALGLEAIGSRRQPVLAAYLAGESPLSVLIELVRREWGYVPGAYAGVVAAAREVGLEVLAVDRRRRRPDGFCRLGDPRCGGRDCGMVDRIAGFEPSPSRRVLVLVGSDHARAGRQPRHLRVLHDLESRSYRFTTDWDEIGPLLREDGERGGIFLPAPRDRAGYDGFVALP